LARQQPAPEVHADALAAYDQALALDHEFANAYAGRGYARILYVLNGSLSPAEVHRQIEQGLADARKAAQLAPALGFAHAIIGYGLSGELNFVGAAAEFEQALALSPGDARVYTHSAFFLSQIGRADESVASARRAVELDPLSFKTRAVLSYVYYWARRYREAIEAGHRAGATEHSHPGFLGWIGLAQAGLGEYQVARSTCDLPNPEWTTLLCLAVVDDKLGQHADALSALETMKKNFGDDTSYQIAEIYAQWGDVPHALEALEAADKAADPGLFSIKVDPLLDPLRHEPRFRAVQAHIRFPD
jgi:tetratricopeptide (TPR) repeat protein